MSSPPTSWKGRVQRGFPAVYLGILLILGITAFLSPIQWVIIGVNIILIYVACFLLLSYFEWRNDTPPVVKKWPMVSILIPAWNRGESLRVCLRHVLEMEYPGKKEIIVLDDGSTDQTQKIVAEFKGKLRGIHYEKNTGKAHVLNEGLKLVKGEFVAVIDGDAYPKKDALLHAIPHFVHDEKVGAVAAIVRVNNNHGWLQRIQELEYFLSFGLHNNMLSYHDAVYVTPGPLSVYRKKALDEAGGYDEQNITEDMEITFHLHELGYRVRVDAHMQVYTDVPETLPALWKQRNRWSYGSWQTMFKYQKHLFSPKKSFFYYFFPQRLILEGSSVIFVFMILRMIKDIGLQYVQTYFSIASIGFEHVIVPAWYVTGTGIMYWMLMLLWLVLLGMGIHIAKAKFDWKSIPSLIIFITVYGFFIISVQFFTLAKIVVGGRQKW
ncbi:MAG: glycosyltransferase [archaeon]